MLLLTSKSLDRRAFLRGLSAGTAFFTTPGLFAEALALTPRQTEGPFYPDKLPLDADNDLVIVNNSATPALGEVVQLSGRILTASGEPVRNAQVEIWQVDANAAYLHSRTGNADKRDRNFQGFGRFETASKGEYRFRTIKPVPYPGRTPHIHFAINIGGKRMLTTQLYVKGHPGNERDGIYRRLGESNRLVTADFAPIAGSPVRELAAHFDVVIGATPEDQSTDRFRRG
jgi:protocatechuate 3,4-dioxygenase beta subunit